ncbi:LexA family transcriptional regulator [Campylobacter fetus]|uniref:XRE family transcriptional regulator n=1 Tax=Campylobacter fetus TaxID=196 RepID=UPI0011CC8A21|nr:LexA family transcriptional regulator [Campylobacter fetus]EAJ1232620.1 LexA family transcriptional regulator [Campylobacter fetus]EAK0414701.1 LexA family transcriptional regulator [Campylobacter fetus]TXF09183.1 LexA family transcriptional regulator [Campylobacter fetus subsp. fetus]
MALAEILKSYMQENKITAEEIANHMDVSRGTVTHWSNGIRKPRTPLQYQKLSRLLGVDYETLIENKLLDQCEISKIVPIHDIKISSTASIGVLEMVAGFGTEGTLDADFKVEYVLELPKEFLGFISPKYAKMIRCLGDSMMPEFNDGDYLLLEMLGGRDFIKRAGIYLVRVNDVVYIKRVEFLPNGDVRLISINPSYPVMTPLAEGYEYEILACVYGKITVKLGAGFQFDNQGIK